MFYDTYHAVREALVESFSGPLARGSAVLTETPLTHPPVLGEWNPHGPPPNIQAIKVTPNVEGPAPIGIFFYDSQQLHFSVGSAGTSFEAWCDLPADAQKVAREISLAAALGRIEEKVVRKGGSAWASSLSYWSEDLGHSVEIQVNWRDQYDKQASHLEYEPYP